MFDRLRRWVLYWSRVPGEPQPPVGAPDSVRVFRAAPNHYRLRVLRWALAQVATLVGILFSLNFLQDLKDDLREPASVVAPAELGAAASDPQVPAPERMREVRRHFTSHVPPWLVPLLVIGEAVGIAVYLLQLPVTFAAARLDYELRWYIVTDRSLRIRSGIMTVQESTMSFANLQQVEVRQGPLQRWLNLYDVRVQSAGGGGGEQHHKSGAESLHTGVFHDVGNGPQIRDLILERLRRFREAGLGDPDEAAGEPVIAEPPSAPALAAAREVLAETRALREALEA